MHIPISLLQNFLDDSTIPTHIHHCDPRNELHLKLNYRIGRNTLAARFSIPQMRRHREQCNFLLCHGNNPLIQSTNNFTWREKKKFSTIMKDLTIKKKKTSKTHHDQAWRSRAHFYLWWNRKCPHQAKYPRSELNPIKTILNKAIAKTFPVQENIAGKGKKERQIGRE